MSDTVSVIIPTHNRAPQLLRAVRSVLEQSHQDLEVLVVDDESTDDTRAVVEAIDDTRVRYLWQPNAGPAAARNNGLRHSRGDYIALLDDDDEWLPWKIEAQIKVLQAFPDAGLVWTDMMAVDTAGNTVHDSYLTKRYTGYYYLDRERDFFERRPLRRIWPDCPPAVADAPAYLGQVYLQMFMGSLMLESTVLIRRERQVATGEFDEAFSAGYDYFLRACLHGNVAFLDAPSTRYQIGGDSISGAGGRVAAARRNLVTIEKVLASPAGAAIPETLVRERLARCHIWIGGEELPDDPLSARRHFAFVLKSRGPLRDGHLRPYALTMYALSFCPPAAYRWLKRANRALTRVAQEARHVDPRHGRRGA
jgi:GT2 family glycosyltransferase